jgi:hypothetical protein
VTDPPRRLIEVGVFPTGSAVFIDGVDPLAILIADANAKLDAEHCEAERTAAAEHKLRAADDIGGQA